MKRSAPLVSALLFLPLLSSIGSKAVPRRNRRKTQKKRLPSRNRRSPTRPTAKIPLSQLRRISE